MAEIKHADTIRIVRIVIKCSDLLYDFDTLEDYIKAKKSKYIKHDHKKIFFSLGEYIDKFSSCFLVPFVEDNEESQMELQKMFTEFSAKLSFKTSERTSFILLYAKIYSIVQDLNEMEYVDTMLSGLKDICDEFLEESLKKNSTILDPDGIQGEYVHAVIQALNDLGKKIMYINKEDEGRIN